MTARKLTLMLSLLACVPPALAAPAACDEPALPDQIDIRAGLQQSLALSSAMTRLAIGEPAVADVAVVNSRTLLLQGKRTGETSLLVWTGCSSEPRKSLVRVAPELVATQQLASPASPSPAEPAVRAVLDKLPAQVQADIRFVEVSRSRLHDVGTRLQIRSLSRPNFFNAPNAGNATGLPSGVKVQAPGSTGPDAPVYSGITDVFTNGLAGIPTLSDSFNILWGGGSRRFMAAINLLEQTGYAYTLSRPSLVALSGQSANFLAGGEVPVPVPQGQNGSVGIEYKEFGVRLTISPTVIDADQILLKVAPEVSELDFSNAVTIQGTIIPALRIRRTDTTISLADGESFIIGGLVSRSTLSNVDKLPGLGNIPILGAFFRSTRFESEDRELLMIVTPRLIRPLRNQAELPPLPGQLWQNYQPGSGSLFWRGVTAPMNERLIPAGH